VIGIIGGTGLYSLFDAEPHPVETPWGPPSDPPAVATVDGCELAFLPRHGADHRHPPHRVPYRANLWALRALGVEQVLAPCAVGALDPALGPGDLVVPDQVIDRTTRRDTTYYDDRAVHVPFADPYCPRGRRTAAERARAAGWPVTDGGTMVVVEGPRFSARAESRAHAAAGGTIINMTGMPEAALARELALCYTPLALVTDRDAGAAPGETVEMADVMRVFAAATDRLRSLLVDVARHLGAERDCPCPHSLAGTPAEPAGSGGPAPAGH
jgi:5'-methylthioadenosine phosphorylase